MTADLASLERLLARTALRVRLTRGLDWACLACAASATSAGTWLLLEPAARWTAAMVALTTTLCFVVGSSLRVRRSQVSAAIDSAGTLDGRVRAASELMELAPALQTAFVRAALRDAAARARDVRPAQAIPLRRPRGALLAVLSLLVFVLLGARSTAVVPAPTPDERSPPEPATRLLAPDELAMRQESARALAARAASSAGVHQQLTDYLALLARLEAGTLEQEAALQQALALESTLRARSEQARAATLAVTTPTRDATEATDLDQLAAELAHARPELSRALASGAWAEAARQLRALAKQTADGALEAAERARLLAALQQARERERVRLAEQQREQALETALRETRETREPSEPSLLKRRNEQQRELETLRRKRATPPKRVLERLERELARLGAALSDDDTAEAQDALDRAAEALDQHERARTDDALPSELARELAQLREQLQQRALSGEDDRPPPPQDGSRARRPAPHEGKPGDGDTAGRRQRQLRFDLEARGQHGAARDGGSGGEPTAGGGRSGPSQLLLLGERTRSTVVTRELASDPDPRPEQPRASTGGGAEHDARELADPTRSRGRYEDRALHGTSGTGPSRSQVIRSAAQGGFASAPYRKVYADYRAHEESVLEHERVPAGYRYHVQRYFELVRPRAAAGQDGRR